jgi:5-methylcytosine-specific restriction endonuclease McrA
MKLLCKLFGHQPPVYAKKGWSSPGQEYGRLESGKIDGIGREHGHVEGKCARCGVVFKLARVHLIKRSKESELESELARWKLPATREKRILADWIDENANEPQFWNHIIARDYSNRLREDADREFRQAGGEAE